MTGQEKFDRFVAKNPHPHRTFFTRPHWTRRRFFDVLGAGVTGSFLAARARGAETTFQAAPQMIGKAKNVVFVMLTGAPSHTDLFDLKVVPGVTPPGIKPETIKGLAWPAGILPKLGDSLGDLAIVRSMRSHALVHGLAQTWTQIGRSPAAVLGDIAPNIGSVVALEKDPDRKPGQVFPTFLALNSNGAAGSGYFDARYAPFKTAPAASGLANTASPDGEARLTSKWSLLGASNESVPNESPFGKPLEDMADFYRSAKGLMYNPVVDRAFKFTAADSQRYGNNGFGNACLVAKQVLSVNQGTRFIQLTLGGWDMHQNIYGLNGNAAIGPNIFTLGKTLDDGLAAMLADLKSSGLLEETLVVVVGEFGRTVGKLSAAGGRDHFLQQFCLFAGGGVKGGRAIGSTNADGSATDDPGWSRARDIRAEDVEATIYSALGINWTTIRYDDPFGRGFEYVPQSKYDLYGPINELWG